MLINIHSCIQFSVYIVYKKRKIQRRFTNALVVRKSQRGFLQHYVGKKIKSSIRKEDKKSKRPKEDNDNSIKDHQNQDKPENPVIEEDNESERELDSEQSQQESDQESSTTDVRDVSGEKLPSSRYYKGDKWFYPGNTLNYSFPEANDEL